MIVYLSGHGFVDLKQNFWFLTREADVERLRATAISLDDLIDLTASIPGKKILLVDASHSGGVVDAFQSLNNVVRSDIVVYAASMGNGIAMENATWDRHSAFAKALIEAIGEGKASIDPSKPITTDVLALYLEHRVKELTDGKQRPVMNRPLGIRDFPLAVANP